MPRLKKKWQTPASVSPSVAKSEITPRYLNVHQAAAYSGVTVWTIRRLITAGLLKAAKMGKRLTVDRYQIDEIWQKRAVAV
jgi:excisionase family DNA binding protein